MPPDSLQIEAYALSQNLEPPQCGREALRLSQEWLPKAAAAQKARLGYQSHRRGYPVSARRGYPMRAAIDERGPRFSIQRI
jgi:hypothetical protein